MKSVICLVVTDDGHTSCTQHVNDDPMEFSFETKVCVESKDIAYFFAVDGSKSKMAILVTITNSAASLGYSYT